MMNKKDRSVQNSLKPRKDRKRYRIEVTPECHEEFQQWAATRNQPMKGLASEILTLGMSQYPEQPEDEAL